jgi:hypothetical protein
MNGTFAGAGCNTWQSQGKTDLTSFSVVRLIHTESQSKNAAL